LADTDKEREERDERLRKYREDHEKAKRREEEALKTCAYCGAPATATIRHGTPGLTSYKLGACDLHKAVHERKSKYMPCVINAEWESMSPEEQAKALRETYWSDNITNTEWPVLLKEPGTKAPTKSKLKKKAVGWLMAFGRIVAVNDALAVAILHQADKLYREQLRAEPPIPYGILAELIEMGWMADSLNEWLRPLCNLRSYNPRQLALLIDQIASSDDEDWEQWQLRGDGKEEQLQEDGNQDEAA